MSTVMRLSGSRWYWLFTAWIIALASSLGALFLSEVIGLVPCELCWYQRIFMFPLVFVFAIGLATSDLQVIKYAWPLVLIGWLVALYHNLLYIGLIPEPLQPCSVGPSCAEADLDLLGFISIPLLSLAAFTMLAFLLTIKKGHSK